VLDDLITAQNITKNLNTELNMRMRHAKTIPPQYHIKTIKEKGTQGKNTFTTNQNTVL